MRRTLLPLVLSAALSTALAAGLSGCGTPADDGRLRIAAGFYPLAWVAERVAGPLAEVSNLTSPGAEPHDLELTVKETADIARADLVIHESGLQPAVDSAIKSSAEGTVLDAASVVHLEPFAAGDSMAEPDSLDPHFWQDPLRMADLGDAVAASLSTIDPTHATEFAANAARLRSDLVALSAAYDEGLADCARSTIVVSHDAFGYLARYGLTMAPIAGLSPGAEPTPADLERLQQLIRTDGITTVFSERLASAQVSRTLATDLGITTAVLDPIEGLTDETAGQDYLSLMRSNLATLKEANGC